MFNNVVQLTYDNRENLILISNSRLTSCWDFRYMIPETSQAQNQVINGVCTGTETGDMQINY